MESIPKLLLVENFKWLLGQLHAFDDPQFTYASVGRQDLRGGVRREYRYEKHYDTYYKGSIITKSPSPTQVAIGNTQIECDEWDITHPKFKDPELKEKYPKPDTHYTVLVTSRRSLQNKTAQRCYVSCDCMDFNTTFKEELLKYGYTNGTTLQGTGKKKLAPAICKHIYSVLMREYMFYINTEDSEQLTPLITWPKEAPPEKEQVPTHYDYEPIEYEEEPEEGIPPIQPLGKPKRGRIPKTPEQKKTEYEKIIKQSLKFIANTMPGGINAYKNTRQGDTSYKKYKFMVKKYFQGWVIVYSNPLLNPFRDKAREKEIVPLINRTARGMLPFGDSTVVYTKYFSKDELMGFIRSETKEIQPNQIEKLNKILKKYTLTESLEVLDSESSSILTTLLGLY